MRHAPSQPRRCIDCRAPTTPTWYIGFHVLAAPAGVAHPVVSAINAFIRSTVLFHAQIWEASVLVSLLKEPEYFEPDPFATESPFSATPGRAVKPAYAG